MFGKKDKPTPKPFDQPDKVPENQEPEQTGEPPKFSEDPGVSGTQPPTANEPESVEVEIIQIAAAGDPVVQRLFGLGDDKCIYRYDLQRKTWTSVGNATFNKLI